MLSARWCKLSLHVAFAMYAAVLLVQQSWLACVAGILFVAAVAWSRLVLDRHATSDPVAGAIARSAASRVGHGCVRTGRYRRSPYHYKNKSELAGDEANK